MVANNIYLFIVWSKARRFEHEVREALQDKFLIKSECEVIWRRRDFVRKLHDFYQFGGWFTWWNKARKCGRGAFKAYIVEDPSPTFSLHRDTRGNELLVNERIYEMKRSLRRITGHSNIVHSSITHEESVFQIAKIFGQDALEYDQLLVGGALTRLGIGQRRSCYLIPGNEMCIKCYRSDDEIREGRSLCSDRFVPLKKSVITEITRNRFSWANICAQEYAYYTHLTRTLPKSLLAIFPSRISLALFPSRGYGLIQSVIANYDGSPVKCFEEEYCAADQARRAHLCHAYRRLQYSFQKYAVRMFDPQNVMVENLKDGRFVLRVADFDPTIRTLIPIEYLGRWIVQLKVRRRFDRYIAKVKLQAR